MSKKVSLASFNNSTYQIGAGFIKNMCWYLCNYLFFKSACPHYGLKVFLLKLFGAIIGSNVLIKPHVNIKYPWKLTIGSNVWIGEQVWIDNLDLVSIGSNVCISQGALLLCGNHNFKSENFDLITAPIILEDGTWIGAKGIVCGGITCRTHSILQVLSVATSNLEAYGIYKGNPAERVKERIIE
ncbi:MAG: colanic acid biosynthesis acetyltransferase WcaF [Bacteroidetes bacterium]|nr:colanic acid biosynthesis acetyltransferase WcaF [Bacteroidota bacterium]